MPSFDLTEASWLPCERPSGEPVELGLGEALSSAHELRALADPSPLVTASLHRLLLAILHRCFGPRDLAEWKRLYRAGRFDRRVVEDYLARWRGRFDLLDAERPFYQVAGLPYRAAPAAELVAERSNYGAPVELFEHRPSGDDGMLAIGAAARALVAAQAFRPGGLVARAAGEPPSATAAPLNAAALVLILGRTLFETLMLNQLVYDPGSGQPIPGQPDDRPAWELEAPAHSGRRVARGWCDLLTWQSRRITLVPAPDGAGVARVIVAGGWDLDVAEGTAVDPMVAYRRDPKRGFVAVRIDDERAAWRDADALVRASDADAARRPRTVDQLASRELADDLPHARRFELALLGLRGDRAKILLTRHETLPVSPAVLADPVRGESIRDGLVRAEEAATSLRRSLWVAARHSLAPAGREPDSKDVRALIEASGGMRLYWSRLRAPFYRFLDGIIAGTPTALDHLCTATRQVAQQAFDAAVTRFGDAARGLKGRALGERSLRQGLATLDAKEVQ